jgi:hypothetical protein
MIVLIMNVHNLYNKWGTMIQKMHNMDNFRISMLSLYLKFKTYLQRVSTLYGSFSLRT